MEVPAPEPLIDRAVQVTATGAEFHATAIALQDRVAMFLGASGAGKSALALELVALGAGLIGDDRVLIRDSADGPLAAPTPMTLAAIEARGIGLIAAPLCPPAPLALVIDLTRADADRLPSRRDALIYRRTVPLIRPPRTPTLAAAVMLLLTHGFAAL